MRIDPLAKVPFWLSGVFSLLFVWPLLAQGPLVSIAPVEGLVQAVMGEEGRPRLLVDRLASPHDFALRPSQAKALQKARIVFWVGEELESFLVRPLETLAGRAKVVTLSQVHGLKRLERRDFEDFENEEKDDHDNDHGHEEHGGDPHFWLDPENTGLWVMAIEKALSEVYPDKAPIFAANSARFLKRLEGWLPEDTHEALPEKTGYIAFHDALQFFEQSQLGKSLGLKAAGVLAVDPDIPLSAGKVRRLEGLIDENRVACLFYEPQFPKKSLALLQKKGIQLLEVDPLGSRVPPGPDHYFQTIAGLEQAFRDCDKVVQE